MGGSSLNLQLSLPAERRSNANVSTFEFFNIATDKEGHVDYIWQCVMCGKLVIDEQQPDECDYCTEHPEENN